MGYEEDKAVQYIAKQRIEKLYSFTKERRYDIYDRDGKYPGVTKAWLPYMIQPSLYADGQIALPDMHDMILFAGIYPYLTEADQEKVETIVAWLFEDGYSDIIRRYGYFYFPNDAYHAKAVIFKLHLMDLQQAKDGIVEKSDLGELIFQVFILAHFKTARKSLWFQLAMDYLEIFRCKNGHYKFPATMIQEKTDCFVMKGGHMNVGENKRKKEYREIISTYWMDRIIQVIDKD